MTIIIKSLTFKSISETEKRKGMRWLCGRWSERKRELSLWDIHLCSEKPNFPPLMSAYIHHSHAPPLLAFPALRVCTLSDKWEEPWLNLLTVCNTAQSANSPHCPDLLYTSQGSGGLLGQVWAVPCCLLLGSCFCNSLSPFFALCLFLPFCLPPWLSVPPPQLSSSSLCGSFSSLSSQAILGPISGGQIRRVIDLKMASIKECTCTFTTSFTLLF